MATVETSSRQARTYGNWRRPTSAGLLGLGAVGTGLLLVGMLVVVLVLMTRGMLEAAITAVVILLLLGLLMVRDSHGKNALSRISNRAGWWVARSRGTNVYRSGPTGRTPWGTNQLPGLASTIRLSEHRDSYNRPFALLFTPSTANYSIVIGTEPRSTDEPSAGGVGVMGAA